jgi:hypothetical protein
MSYFFYFLIACFLFGVFLSAWLGLNNSKLEDQIRMIPDPMIQQMAWQHYETWRNENLPMSSRQAAIQAVYSAIAHCSQ